MNIEQLRNQFMEQLSASGKSLNATAKELGIEQSSLYRFVYNSKVLNGRATLRVLDFIQGKPAEAHNA